GEYFSTDFRRLEVHEAIGAAGELLPLRCAVLNNKGEGDSYHGEISAGHAKRRQGQHEADPGPDYPGKAKPDPKVETLDGKDRRRIRTDGIEADVSQRYLAGQSDQDIEPDANHGCQCDQRQKDRNLSS